MYWLNSDKPYNIKLLLLNKHNSTLYLYSIEQLPQYATTVDIHTANLSKTKTKVYIVTMSTVCRKSANIVELTSNFSKCRTE